MYLCLSVHTYVRHHIAPLFWGQLGSMSGIPTGGWKSSHQVGGFPTAGLKSYYWLEILLIVVNPTGWKSYYWLEIISHIKYILDQKIIFDAQQNFKKIC